MTHNDHWEPIPRKKVTLVWQWLKNAGLTISKQTFQKWNKVHNMRIAGYEYQDIAKSMNYSPRTSQSYYFRAKKCLECYEKNDIDSILKWVKRWGHYGK
ncbi:unnamed protein product [marine sediment metagenome]|uniref:RNA polymerase sigma factor 70 region 4 type 2 domain-containing protein n=1 Tax=marine sediment metagenome TaxID=412755 RepID=X1J6H9_9ZZZZ